MSAYATRARRYWETYRPKACSQIAESQRETFFADLGKQVEGMVEYLTEDNLRASSRDTDNPERLRRKRGMAQLRAEEEALEELVFLPKEPGTEHLPMPTTLTAAAAEETAEA
jgi:hypothetical protein